MHNNNLNILRNYLDTKGISIAEFCRRIGYERNSIYGYLNGKIRLGFKAARAIEKETKGVIPADQILANNPPKNKSSR